jgi:inner membrane transporter RhtA
VTRIRPGAALGVVPPPVLVLTGIVSVQVGAGLAARLFTEVPPAAVTGLRLWTAAVLLAVIGWRGLAAAVRGVTLAIMNFSIYQAFARVPLGIAVTVEFLGPLAVAVAASRRLLDLLWVALAATGVLLLARGGGTAGPTIHDGRGVMVTGIAFALAAGASWAAYILLSAATGRHFPGSSGLAIAMLIAGVLVTPTGVISGGTALLRPGVLAAGVAIGLLSSIIPYSLELEALRRIPPQVFGIWMSLEPAVAALVGVVMLGQNLVVREWAAIGCVMVACAGATRSGGFAGHPPPPPAEHFPGPPPAGQSPGPPPAEQSPEPRPRG